MTLRRTWRRAGGAATIVAALVLAGCSTRAPEPAAGGGGGQVATDVGVSAEAITLGVLTDTSGPFRNLGTGITQGNQLWADELNGRGGICGRKVELEVADSGYKADTATTVYRQQQPNVLGYLQLLGSPINAALRGNLETDEVTSLALSWSSFILDNPYQIIPGTTYDLEMINGLAYLQQQGLIADGDTLGHIYIGGEYGDNGFLGAQYYAQQHGMALQPAKVAAADTDMTNIVTGFQGAGVKAILLTTTPAQTASALNAASALGLNVPVVGNNPVFDPATNLAGPAAASVGNLYVVASSVPYSAEVPKAKEVQQAFEAKFPDAGKNYGVPYGYAGGLIWEQILTKACENGDLTRKGVHDAFLASQNITTGDLVASELDFSKAGSPPSRSVYIAQADPAQEGGLRQVVEPFTAAEAQAYKAPHQQGA
ncbi:ABC transporter substrate-binding protein [Pseudonocardia cypriaca]|uniref:Amino acid/amide ABC transporter substrate-binding protein (HAAT family) n=1 Tax=Pseudonocardia cypriaca TaxID=882449 RepID=A0A543FP34_9PSEU|nr:ABC transporter substrate-binding protein [Pseudonocardia cypriaca]TQM35571.1 amino acid/amide ABC transporter substrate-binding protein (HAAT family) [Pseudonocardia cypriaca]